MVGQTFEVECWRLTSPPTCLRNGSASASGSGSGSGVIAGKVKSEGSKPIRNKLSMPPLKHRSASHNSSKEKASTTSRQVDNSNHNDRTTPGSVEDERMDTFGLGIPGLGLPVAVESKRKDHGGNIFRRLASRNRTSSSSSTLTNTSTDGLPQSSTFTSLSSLISPTYELSGLGQRRGSAERKSSFPGNGETSGSGLASGSGFGSTSGQGRRGSADQGDHRHRTTTNNQPGPSSDPSEGAGGPNREWTRVRVVLSGNMGVGPNSGLAGAQRRSSATGTGAGQGSTGVGSGSGVKVEVFDASLSNGRPLFTFDPTILRSTDISLPHKSLFPSRTDKVIRLTNLTKPLSTSILGGPPIGLGPVGWDVPDGAGMVDRNVNKRDRPVPLDLSSNSPAFTDGSAPGSLSSSASDHWATPMMSPGSFDSSGRAGFGKHVGLPSRLDGSPSSPTFGLPSSETIRDLAHARRIQEQESLGRKNGGSTPRSPVLWYGTGSGSGTDTPANRFRTTRSKASNSSLRTNTTTESDDSWRSATDIPVLPASSPMSTNFYWTKLDVDGDAPSVENGGQATSKTKKRESMTPRANRVLQQFPDRDSDGLELVDDRVDEGEVPNDLLLTFATKAETRQWYALLKSFTSNDYITLVSGNDMSTNLTRSNSRPSPSLYSAFSANGGGGKAEWARIWRSLEIKIQDVKGLDLACPARTAESQALANARPVPAKRGMLRSISSGFGQTLKGLMDDEETRHKQEDTLYWSVSVDGQTMARTPKRRVDTMVWTETIKLEDIDEWHKCTLRLYRRTRFSGQPSETVCLGYVRVDALDLADHQTFEKKLPLLAFLTSDVLGQVRLSLKADQLNVKGLAAYDVITDAIQSGDAKRIYKVAETASAEGGAAAICRIAMAKGLLEPLICTLIDEEVQTPSATLFRSNTPLTRCLEYVMRVEAVDYVRDTIGEEMRSLCSESLLDTGRIGDVSVAVSRIWDKIYMSRHDFPRNLRWVFSYLLKAVARYHPNNKPLQLHSVSAFVFLRLVGPCIMWPETFGIIDFHPREEVEQRLKAIAKPLINLGFLTEPKEGDRSPVDAQFSGDFHRDNVSAMMDYLAVCASYDSAPNSDERETDPILQRALQTRRSALLPSHTDSEAVLHVTRQLLVDVAKDTAWLYRIRQQKSEAEARKDSMTSSAQQKTRTVSVTSTQSGQSVWLGSSPASRTSTLPTTSEDGGPTPTEAKPRSRRTRPKSPREPLVGPPPIIGQRTSSIHNRPAQAVKMVSLGQPI